jgi:hypothetical protein
MVFPKFILLYLQKISKMGHHPSTDVVNIQIGRSRIPANLTNEIDERVRSLTNSIHWTYK